MTLPKWLLTPLAVGISGSSRYAPDRHPQPSEIWTDVDWYDRLHVRWLPLPLPVGRSG